MVRLAGIAVLLFTAAPGAGADALEGGVAKSSAGNPPAKREPLDLSIGDISRYVDAARLATPLPEELEEIIVWGRVPGAAAEQRLIPQGLGAIAYAVANPLQSWRILAPDPNLQLPQRSEDDLRDPPGAHRARILEPGRVYD